MRNFPKLMFNRVVVVSLSILLQIAVLLAGMLWLNDYRSWINIALSVISWVAVVYIMSDKSNPSYKIAWIVLILAFPVAGVTIYLLFGGNKASSRENRKMERISRETHSSLPQDEAVMEELRARGDAAYNHTRYLLHTSHYPVYHNSEAAYYPIGEECFAAMCEDLETAEHYIFLEYFIIDKGKMWDTILEILCRKAAAGVDVRVLYDDFGCITRLPGNYPRQLREMGIRAHAFKPFVPVLSGRLNNRDHRKLMIVDGKTAYTGGVNLADEYINIGSKFGHWKDCGIRVKGEAAWSMAVMFLTMWDYVDHLEEDIGAFRPFYDDAADGTLGYVQPFADSPLDYEDVGATAFSSLIQSARERVWIMTPYLILDDKMSQALCRAAKTGVDVRIITPGIPDKRYVYAVTRANYDLLLEAGVRILSTSRASSTRRSALRTGCMPWSARSIWTSGACTCILRMRSTSAATRRSSRSRPILRTCSRSAVRSPTPEAAASASGGGWFGQSCGCFRRCFEKRRILWSFWSKSKPMCRPVSRRRQTGG